MRRLRSLMPGFMKALDRYLLVNHPHVWITRVHHVLFFAVIINIVAALLGLVFPISLMQVVDIDMWFGFFTIISIVCMAIWVYRFVLFNVEKNFGNRSWAQEFLNFFLALICVLSLSCLPFTFTKVLNEKTANLVANEELMHDINTLNIGDIYFPESGYEYATDDQHPGEFDFTSYVAEDVFTPWFYRDSAAIFKSTRIAKEQLKQDTRAEKLRAIKEYLRVLKKYGGNIEKKPNEVLAFYEETVKAHQVLRDAGYWEGKGPARKAIFTIAQAKEGDQDMFRKETLWIVLYLAFYLVITLLIFKSVRWQQFLIMLAVFALGPILLLLMDTFLHHITHERRGNLFLFMVIAIYVFCFIQSLVSFANKRFSPFRSICIMVFALLTPVMGLVVIEYLHDTWIWRPQNTSYYLPDGTYVYHNPYMEAITMAIWMGPCLYTVLLLPLVKESLVKLHSLPRKK